jgi:hypothetical protein
MVRTTLRIEMPSVDIDNDNAASGETGIFEIESWTLEQRQRTGFIVGENPGDFRQIVIDKVQDDKVDGISKYRDFHVNEGTGNRIFDVTFTAYEGDSSPTWGDPNEPQGTAANATDQDILERMQVMERYFAAVAEDSRNPITLKVGGYSSGEIFDTADINEAKLTVVAENPTFRYNPREGSASTFTGEITFIETVTADGLISAVERILRDAT